MEKVCKMANLYVATLRAIYLIEQHCHWTTRSDCFYADHLLFERLYKSASENSDAAAEKMIGLFGEEGLNYEEQCNLIHKIVVKYADLKSNPVKQALTIEKDFVALSEQLFNEFEKEDVLSLGLDDLICALSNSHETACYLLQQTLDEQP